MKLMVTGGAGFIGSNFIRYILNHHPDWEVINFDKLTYAGNLENLKDIANDPRYSFVKGDITDSRAVEETVARVGCSGMVVNFAAETHVDRSIVSAGSFVNTDVYGTHVLLEAVKKFGTARYLHISTDEVYGSIERGSFTEESTLAPNSPYAASKAGGDLLIRSYFKTFGLPVVITRSSNNYGPYQYPEKVIPLFITNALQGRKLPLYGDGRNVRDWLYVEDNCEAIDLVLQKGGAGEIYNIGGGNERQNIEITKFILKELGLADDFIQPVKDRPGHDRRYSVDCSKVRKLGWAPKTKFEAGLKKTIEWYRNNRGWWSKLIAPAPR
ncbi:dTDP-glucose 4,6-dehydratase [candidate division WOR-1 bacterium RIFCSPHIGHO2_01_FULL_53_15]|uniref:dTDP-glucose 4,6-dehydratase n=1 Tax=candidate division WOR-1 bacterium RIFCSPHIGHO2_01_FULL_53_15 TaxID=1802564 RepID=A0A1F4Q2Q0_UNCSA|nr:MAG: dTDP-glucose 4,6-dehydratase [candidate division WOR-1 bacterium RIFCSPHIGHO2_01_FULL_53_15]OGC10357.1 MAG: dTDP-glucose 4,6-dehydratase [candidate division WOR-1 bacterium RIFCSPHIGHO2_02_FULL_53_26]